jgi:Protein of unknown function (DUF2934)
MDTDWLSKVRARAYAIWQRLGRPEDAAERHWAQAEEELRAEEGHGPAGAEAPPVVEEAAGTPGQGAASAAAGTETWTGQDGSVGGEPEAGDRGEGPGPAAGAAKATGKTAGTGPRPGKG